MNIIYLRLSSFLIDIVISAGFGILIGLVFLIFNIVNFGLEINLTLLTILFKDHFNGNGSIGKNILKIKIVDYYQWKSVFRLIRNFTLIIWPIELCFLLIKKKRLGDLVAKTHLEINI